MQFDLKKTKKQKVTGAPATSRLKIRNGGVSE